MNKNLLMLGFIGIIAAMIFIGGCVQNNITPPQNNVTSKNGFLEGDVSIGPLCPVAKNPPDPTCAPTRQTYDSWPIYVYTSDKTKVAQITPDLDGTYKVDIAPGTYIVDLINERASPIAGRSNLPFNITITSQETTTLDIDIDTGIR